MHMPPGAPERRWQQAAANGPTKARAPPRRAGPGAPATLGYPHRAGGGPRGSGRAGASPPPEPGRGPSGGIPELPGFQAPPGPWRELRSICLRGRQEPGSRTGRHGASGPRRPRPRLGESAGARAPLQAPAFRLGGLPRPGLPRELHAAGAHRAARASRIQSSEFSATPGRLPCASEQPPFAAMAPSHRRYAAVAVESADAAAQQLASGAIPLGVGLHPHASTLDASP